MEISLLKVLLNNISSFLRLSSYDNINLDPVQKYYQRTEEILKLLKPILDAIIDSKLASDEVLNKTFEDFSHSVDELRELFENWQPLLSKVYFVLQVESLISKIRASALDIFQLLKSSHQSLPDELSLTSLEHCSQKIKHIEHEHTSSLIKDAIRDQVDGIVPGSESLEKFVESLSLRSNQEIRIEAVALEKLKENAEQAEKAGEAEFMDQMIALVTRMHDRPVMIKQSQICSPVPITPGFCCPLSLELMKVLLNNISSFLHLSSYDNINLDPVQKYYQRTEEILKLLKPILDAIIDSKVASDEVLNKTFEDFSHSVDELRELFENWQPLLSRAYFVLQVESLISRIRASALDIFQLLKSSHQSLSDELSLTSLEHCLLKIKHIELEHTSSFIKDVIRDQVDGIVPGSETLVRIAESLSLRSNQEILIEAVALEKLKENAEQAEKAGEAEFMDQMIALVTRMHDRLVMIKQSQICSPVPIPPDFCCPLSLELMTDPVIVASGQTYERAFIKKWIDLGLTVCPKTRQTLAHTTLIPNYTVKALIANWCELNNVKLPDPMKIMSLNQPSPLLHGDSTPPRDSQVLPPSRGNQPTMPESIRSAGSPGKNLSATVNHREGSTPLHPRSASEVNLTGTAGNGQALDIARMSLTSSEGRYTNSEERSTELDGQHSVSPSRRASSTSADAVEESSQVHNRTASASSVLSNSSFSQGVVGDANETSEGPNYHTEASGEVKSEPQASGTVTTAPREPEFASRLLSRNHMIWRRPSERFVPRIVSNSSEARPDLSGIEAQVRKLIEDLNSTSVDAQREAVVELRLLAKHSMDNRMVIANCGAISLLVNMLHSKDTKIQENAVTALLNLSINDNNKTAIANAEAIGPLIHVLETGSPEAKENSAATLFSLSVIEDNKIRIGRSGAIGPLVDLLGNGTPRGKKDAATALFNLSIYHENKARIVQAGAVRHLVELMDPAAGMVDKAVAVLANLATIQEGRTAIGQENGIPVLVEVVELGSARGKENAAAALLQLCTNSNRFCNMVLQEGAVPPLVALSQSGTARAKEKAQALLSFFRNQRHGNAGRA